MQFTKAVLFASSLAILAGCQIRATTSTSTSSVDADGNVVTTTTTTSTPLFRSTPERESGSDSTRNAAATATIQSNEAPPKTPPTPPGKYVDTYENLVDQVVAISEKLHEIKGEISPADRDRLNKVYEKLKTVKWK